MLSIDCRRRILGSSSSFVVRSIQERRPSRRCSRLPRNLIGAPDSFAVQSLPYQHCLVHPQCKMKQKLDHVPERVTTFTISNSQEFFEIQIPRSTDNNGGISRSASINEHGTHDASGSIHGCVGSRHHQKNTIPNHSQQKGAQCTSGATPKRRTPHTSQHEDLLSGPSRRSPMPPASQDNKEDDFEPALKRPRPKVPAHKDPKSNKTMLPPIQEEDDDGLPAKINSRCIPKHALDAINKLSEPQKKRVRDLGWGKFLEIAIDCVESRNLFLFLLDKLDTNSMVLRVPPNIELPVNKPAVDAVLGVPAGTQCIPEKSSKELSNAKREFMAQLGIATNKITVTRLLEEVAKGNADDLSMKCFFLVIFNRLLFPGTGYDIANTDLQLIMDFQNFGKVDWQQAVIDHLRISAKDWQSPGAKDTTNPTIRSCAPFLLIYYLENLDHPLNDNNHRMVVPRAALFSKQHISTLTNADRWADKDDRICYGKLRQKNPIGSAYQKVYTMQHTAVPASFQLPQLSDLLRGVLDNVAANSNPHFIHLITTVDRDIRANQKVIHERHHANECLLIKFSEDVKELFANVHIPTVTNVHHLTNQQAGSESCTRNLQQHTLQHKNGDLAGPSHTDTVTVRVEKMADATQQPSRPAVARQETVAFRDEQASEEEQPLTETVGDHIVNNLLATAKGIDVVTTGLHIPTMVGEQVGKQPHGSAHLDTHVPAPEPERGAPSTSSNVDFDFSFDPNGDFDFLYTQPTPGIQTTSEAADNSHVSATDHSSSNLHEPDATLAAHYHEGHADNRGTVHTPSNIQGDQANSLNTTPHTSIVQAEPSAKAKEILVDEVSLSKERSSPHHVASDIAAGASGVVGESTTSHHMLPPFGLFGEPQPYVARVDEIIGNLEQNDCFNQYLQNPNNLSNIQTCEQAHTKFSASHHSNVEQVKATSHHAEPGSKAQVHSFPNTETATRPRKMSGMSPSNLVSPNMKRPLKTKTQYCSPLKAGRIRKSANLEQAIAMTNTICSDTSPFLSTKLMHFSNVSYTGLDIKASLWGGSEVDRRLLDDCIKCLAYDDRQYRPECYGRRIMLGPNLCHVLNPEELGKDIYDKEFNADILVANLKTYLPTNEYSKAKLIHLVMLHEERYSVYCINVQHKRIDILDFFDYQAAGTKFSAHHDEGLMHLLQLRLSDAFQTISKKFPIFSTWRRCRYTQAPVAKHANECAVFAMRFIESYNGDRMTLISPLIEPGNSSQLWADFIYYMLFHPTNAIRTLPGPLEMYRQAGVPF